MRTALLALIACTGTPSTPDPVPVPIAAPVAAPEPAGPRPLPVATDAKYAATHVIVAWQGAVGAPATVTRTEPLARALAEEIRAKALAGEPLEDLAKASSDGPSAARGGHLGVYLTGTMVPEFEAAVASVAVGEIGPLVRTPFGWHVVRRDAVVEIDAAQIVVTWAGAVQSKATRTKDDARARIEEAQAALSGGTSFEDVAKTWSDGPEGALGGTLGTIAPGQMIPSFEDAAFALDPGQTSAIVETPYGFHLIRRTR